MTTCAITVQHIIMTFTPCDSHSRIGSFPGADSHDSPRGVHEVVKATETLINESVVQDTNILIKEGKENDSRTLVISNGVH